MRELLWDRLFNPCFLPSSFLLFVVVSDDILDYSKIEAGHLTLSPSPHNVADVVETAVMLCFEMATSKGLTCSWFIDPNLAPSLIVDASRLQQIMLNLLSNAIKVRSNTPRG